MSWSSAWRPALLPLLLALLALQSGNRCRLAVAQTLSATALDASIAVNGATFSTSVFGISSVGFGCAVVRCAAPCRAIDQLADSANAGVRVVAQIASGREHLVSTLPGPKCVHGGGCYSDH